MKRNNLLVLLLILVCMLALLAGCGGEKDNPGTEENGWRNGHPDCTHS